MKKALFVELHLTEYMQALRTQHEILERKLLRGGPDVVLMVEHPPTITLGRRGDDSHLLRTQQELDSMGVKVHEVDRGGGATFHGPGQLVCYPIIDLRNPRIRVRDYVRGLEDTIIETLKIFGVTGFRQDGKTGVWVDADSKIASVGVRIKQRLTLHGFSINVQLEDDPETLLISCDMPDINIVSLNDFLDRPVDLGTVNSVVARSFCEVFDVSLERSSLERALT